MKAIRADVVCFGAGLKAEKVSAIRKQKSRFLIMTNRFGWFF
jgi:hypothetical protein